VSWELVFKEKNKITGIGFTHWFKQPKTDKKKGEEK